MSFSWNSSIIELNWHGKQNPKASTYSFSNLDSYKIKHLINSSFQKEKPHQRNDITSDLAQAEVGSNVPLDDEIKAPPCTSTSVDKICRVVFPVLFGVFNLIYWFIPWENRRGPDKLDFWLTHWTLWIIVRTVVVNITDKISPITELQRTPYFRMTCVDAHDNLYSFLKIWLKPFKNKRSNQMSKILIRLIQEFMIVSRQFLDSVECSTLVRLY